MTRGNCVVSSCANKKEAGITFHKFPNNLVERRHWIQALEKLNQNIKIRQSKSAKVCSRHFKSCCFKTHGGSRAVVSGHCPSQDPFELSGSHVCDQTTAPDSDAQSIKEQQLQFQVTSLQNKLKLANLKLSKKNKQIKYLQLQIQRKESQAKVKKAKTCLKCINNAKRELIARKSKSVLDTIGTRNPTRGRAYTDKAKEFAIKMAFRSSAAYNYLRKETGNLLPHIRTVSRFTSGIVVNPGFLRCSLDHLKAVCEKNPHMKFVLVFDEIAIRQQFIVQDNMIKGGVDYGSLNYPIKNKLASHALFAYAASINGSTRLPIGYFLTSGLHSSFLKEVFTSALTNMHSVNANTIGITFDGLSSNFTACKKLGAVLEFNKPNFRTSFAHPNTGENVFVLPDVSHMFKLLRNSFHHFQEMEVTEHGQTQVIQWKFLEELQKYQSEQGLLAANKISSRHIHFGNQKMKTKLAVQLMSSSVASGLETCRKLNLPQFEGCEATIRFLRLVDRLFDACNARPAGQGQKAPLDKDNVQYWSSLFDYATEYLKKIHVTELMIRKNGSFEDQYKPLMETKRGTCVKGWCILITSMKRIMYELVLPNTSELCYMPTYRLGQDVIELFFATIRSRMGWNNNPNILQLQAALRSILAVKIDPTSRGNCVPQEPSFTSTLCLSRIRSCTRPQLEQEMLDDDEDVPDLPSINDLSLYVKNVVVYIAGFVGRKLYQLLGCETCRDGIRTSSFQNDLTLQSSEYVLINEKNQGSLFIPSYGLVEACKAVEQIIRAEEHNGIDKLNIKRVVELSVRLLLQNDCFPDLRTISYEDHNFGTNHVYKLLNMIALQYTKIRFFHMARQCTLKINPTTKRNLLTREVIFSGQ